MPSVYDYLDEIDKWKNNLADELNDMGVYALRDEKLNTLVPKVSSISGIHVNFITVYNNGLMGEVVNLEEVNE